jgi:hypothetical protein
MVTDGSRPSYDRPRYDRPGYDRPKIWYLQGRVRGWGYDYCATFQPLCRISVITLYPSRPLYNLSVVFCSLSMPVWASLCPLCSFSFNILHPL